VPAGSHRVVFTYQDRALWLGMALASTTAVALGGLWLWRRRRRGDDAHPPANSLNSEELRNQRIPEE
jgi:hypothetical protein